MMATRPTILIFGAGINQLELIREAIKLGIITVVVDPAAEPPGKPLSDFFYQVQGEDYDFTKRIALEHQVNGIVTGQMEKPLRLMARLACELNLTFHTPEALERSLDKWLMKQTFMANDIPCARGKLFTGYETITEESLSDFSYPLIIKPKDAFSSRGVYKVDRFEELSGHLEETRSFASDGDILVEEFLDGKEFSIESVTFKGITTIIQITEKFITPFPNTVEMGHLQPAPLSAKEQNSILKIVESAIRAIGIDNSASHTEVILTAKGPKMIEIGARLGGDFIASYLTKASTGVSMDKAAVQVALGFAPDLHKKHNHYSYVKYLELPIGKKVVKVESIDDLFELPGLVFAHIFVKAGDVIQPVTHSGLRPACIIVEADTSEKVMNYVQKYMDLLIKKIILEPGNFDNHV
jgi:carbamoyl-phosphate synthase large subunit